MANAQKIRIRLKAYDHELTTSLQRRSSRPLSATALCLPIPLPTEKQIVTILRAVHKYKDSRVSSSSAAPTSA